MKVLNYEHLFCLSLLLSFFSQNSTTGHSRHQSLPIFAQGRFHCGHHLVLDQHLASFVVLAQAQVQHRLIAGVVRSRRRQHVRLVFQLLAKRRLVVAQQSSRQHWFSHTSALTNRLSSFCFISFKNNFHLFQCVHLILM